MNSGAEPVNDFETSASFRDVSALAGDAEGNVYIASQGCPAIWKVDHSTHLMSRVVGTEWDVWSPDGATAAEKGACPIRAMAVSGDGLLHFVEQCTNVHREPCQAIRKVDASGALATVLGNAWLYPPSAPFGDGVEATHVLTSEVSTMGFDTRGSLYYAELLWNRVRMIVGTGGVMRPAAGTYSELSEWSGEGGTWHTVRHPGGILDHFDPDGKLVKTWAPDDSAVGYQYTFEYGPSGRLSAVRDAANRTATFAYLGGKLDAITDFSGARTEFRVNASGDLISVERSGFADTRRTFGYGPDHLLQTQTARHSTGDRTTTYHYDDHDMVRRVEVGGATRRTITAADGILLANDMGWEEGDPLPFVPQESASPPGGFPFVGTVVDERGSVMEYAFGSARTSGGWRTTTTPAGYVYDLAGATNSNHQVTGFSYYANNTTADVHRSYDGLGRLVEEFPEFDEPGHSTTYVYDGLCNRPTLKRTTWRPGDAVAAEERWVYDTECRLTAHTAPSGRLTTYAYDPVTHLLAKELDAAGTVLRRYDYDERERVLSVTEADGRVTTYSYTAADLVEQEVEEGTSGRRRMTTRGYDRLGRTTWVETSPGVRTEYVYYDETLSGCCGGTSRGPDEVIDPDGNTTAYDYDADGRVRAVTDAATGFWTEYAYEGAGSLVSQVILHDAADRPVRTTGYGYDWRGRLLSVTAGGGMTTYEYPVARSDAAVSQVTDAEGRRSSYTWGLGNQAWYRQVTSATLPDSGTETYTHDGLGRTRKHVRATGNATHWDLDAAGRIVEARYGNESDTATEWKTEFTYEVNGDALLEATESTGAGVLRGRTTFERDVLRRVERETREQGGRLYDVRYDHDDLGNVEWVTYPSGMEVWYRRELADPDRVSSVVAFPATGPSTTLASSVSYTTAGLLTGYAMGNGMQYGIQRGARGRVERVTAGSPVNPAAVLDLQYHYTEPTTGGEDPTGNIRWIHDAVDVRDAEYTYDEQDRLTSATGWWGSLGWTYDRTGNRLTETRRDPGSTTDEVSAYSYEDPDGGGELPTNSRLLQVTGAEAHELAYDGSGNAIRYDDLCLRYDRADRLTQLRKLADPAGSCVDCTNDACAPQVVQENAYDYKFRRTQRVEYTDADGVPLPASRCTAFLYDQYDRLIAEHECASGDVLAQYVYLEGYHVLAVRRGDAWYWYLNDHLPTPKKLADASGTVVWDGKMEPFGTTDATGATVDQSLRFPGQIRDTGVSAVHNSLRTYVPSFGRYLAPDASLTHSCGRPAISEAYAYARNDPTRWTDPTGAYVQWTGCSSFSPQVTALYRKVKEQNAASCAGQGSQPFADTLHDALFTSKVNLKIRCYDVEFSDPVDPTLQGECGTWSAGLGAGHLGVSTTFRCGGGTCVGTNAIHELLHELVYGSEDEQGVRDATNRWVRSMGLWDQCRL
ncbi:MAG: RHS domain-containing protein [Deltaproteobacteria bacterium]|nr:RHS domain-containing protein [Deltaproteobacteria bacterium]